MSSDDDLDRLQQKLAKLAAAPAVFGPEGRLVGRAPDLLAALLTEVDETMQPRRLSFTAGRGTALVCEAYGRRLLSLSGLPGWDRRPLDEAAAADLRVALDGWLQGAAVLYVRAEPLPDSRDPAQFGIAAEALAAVWGLALEPLAEAPSPLDALLAHFDGRAQTWLRVSQGAADAWGGKRETVALLTQFAAEALPGVRVAALAPGSDDRRCVVLGAGAEAVALALDGAEALAMRLSLTDLTEVNRIWQDTTAT